MVDLRFSPAHQRIWLALRPRSGDSPQWMPGTRLQKIAGTGIRQVRGWLDLLRDNGYAQIQDGLDEASIEVRLVKDRNTGLLAPLGRGDGTLYDPNLAGEIEYWQLAIWRNLQIAKSATRWDLQQKFAAPPTGLINYLPLLGRFGWLARERRYHRHAIWRPLRDDPTPPFMVCSDRGHQLFDPTTGEYLCRPQ